MSDQQQQSGGAKKKGNAAPVTVKLVLQQCLTARLKLPSGETASIGRGMVVFVCFRQGADEDSALKAAETVCSVRLCEKDDGGRVSIVDLPGDVLVIPQATLGGKAKGRAVQYHGNVGKEQGEALYGTFCRRVSAILLGENEEGSRSPPPPPSEGGRGGCSVLQCNSNNYKE